MCTYVYIYAQFDPSICYLNECYEIYANVKLLCKKFQCLEIWSKSYMIYNLYGTIYSL